MNLTVAEMEDLTNSTSEAEWNAACDRIKKARGGAYPDDWYAKVLLSGLAARTSGGLSK